MKNMKFKVETNKLGESNLDEIVTTLESKGYKQNYMTDYIPQSVKCLNGLYQVFSIHTDDFVDQLKDTLKGK